jgi:biopolymer transport protein ExbD
MPIQKARFRISDYNKNRKIRLGKHERKVQMVSLSLTSMVDMFAILVIFLLTSSSSVTQWLEIDHPIDLPKAKASDVPQKAATIQISSDAIYGDAKPLITIREASNSGPTIDVVRRWLARQDKKKGYVNVVADSKVSFGIIRRVVASCQEAGFSNVNLAVQPKG